MDGYEPLPCSECKERIKVHGIPYRTGKVGLKIRVTSRRKRSQTAKEKKKGRQAKAKIPKEQKLTFNLLHTNECTVILF